MKNRSSIFNLNFYVIMLRICLLSRTEPFQDYFESELMRFCYLELFERLSNTELFKWFSNLPLGHYLFIFSEGGTRGCASAAPMDIFLVFFFVGLGQVILDINQL